MDEWIEFKRVFMREMVEPWALPLADFLARMLRKMGWE